MCFHAKGKSKCAIRIVWNAYFHMVMLS
jgi:hypothetical protein